MAMSIIGCINRGGGEGPTHLSSKAWWKVKEVGLRVGKLSGTKEKEDTLKKGSNIIIYLGNVKIRK